MVTGDNLTFIGGLDNTKVKFISRMPATFGMVDTLTKEAVYKNTWDDIGILSEEKKGESANYSSYEKEVGIEGRTFRVVVIHSDFYDRRKKKKIDRKTQKDLEKAKKIKKKLTQMQYFCKKDAEVAAENRKLPKYHRLKIDIEEKKIYKKGRPKNGKKEIAEVRYMLRCDIV